MFTCVYQKGIKMKCRGCGDTDLVEMIDLGRMPSVGGFLNSISDFENDKLYQLNVHVCTSCGLVQILNPIDPDTLFKNYSFSSSTVKPLITHFNEYAKWIKYTINPKKVLEFGCNDGILLEKLNENGIKSTGIDISENITELARAKGLDVHTGYFTKEFASQLKGIHGYFDVVSGSNAFAHNANPLEILEASSILLDFNGILCLEVMYAGDLLEKFQWDTLYHEHLTFYSLGTIERLLEKSGFYIFDALTLPMHGGSLRIAASKNKNRSKSLGYKKLCLNENDLNLNNYKTWVNFGKNATNKIEIVKEIFGELSVKNRVAAYGAAGKASMWFNAAGMNYLEYVVDESPLRAGKYMPGTHTKIVFPDHFKSDPPDYMLISAWNYSNVIVEKENWYNGTWAVPLPSLSFFK